MKLSDNGRALIKGFEGLSLKAYPDTTKGYSIGYGHFGAKKGDVITLAEANRLFDQDAVKYEAAVSYTTPTSLQHEFDAMVSLAYNIGTGDVQGGKGGFAGSTVARLHNMGDRQGAADAFRMWNKSDGAVNPVLVKRREKERAIYLSGYSPTGAYPSAPPSSSPTDPPSGWTDIDVAPTTLAPPVPTVSTRAASVGGLAALVLGWLLYRVMQR